MKEEKLTNSHENYDESQEYEFEQDEEEVKKIHLVLEDDSEVDAKVLDIFKVNDEEYIALLPDKDQRVFLYKYEENEEGIRLNNIENQEEFELVSNEFMKLFEGSED
ncbi:DUF1292 domain-containing protein [Caldisalinibacter kiritimatiensis]|uniref:DUF1292 domain-containing protein n=1 Tax=Caldisalinibacter kiritimatiensis TaxID=1304284 RepID=R1CYD7_9FIRM|nr:DUF1292 domain-containing protein [Caldisalinibacter kiritimatiensis]EOD01589.1 Protein of unknown function DUF1292 [Caldisalinibacter kiritimatiensis]